MGCWWNYARRSGEIRDLCLVGLPPFAEIEDGKNTGEEDISKEKPFLFQPESELINVPYCRLSFSTATCAATWLASFLL